MRVMKDLGTMDYEHEISMSNFDHTVDEGLDKLLRDNEARIFAQHAARDFCGHVWFENGKFHNQVHRRHQEVDELEADTLEELMTITNAKWGDD